MEYQVWGLTFLYSAYKNSSKSNFTLISYHVELQLQCNQSKPVSAFRLFALFNKCNDDDLAKSAEYVRVLMSSL